MTMYPSSELDAAGIPKLEMTALEQTAIEALNLIKAWIDTDWQITPLVGNVPFPQEARTLMEAALMLAAARRRGVR
jgi:hypothetical protein